MTNDKGPVTVFMTTIQAWQHIYSNVEKEQSPSGRGGFQTLFYSKAGLTPDEISEMEGRLLYFPSKTAEPIKRLFFVTSSGKAVVAQIAVLPEPDQFGRQGRYLAHALALPLQDLLKIGGDPFSIFQKFTFLTSVAEAIKQGNFKSGDIPPVSLAVTPALAQAWQIAQPWSPAEFKKLTLLALRVEQQTAQREAITFAGTPEQIETALEAAFLAVPTRLRPRCTFDTYFYRCNLVATFYWAIGLPEPPVSIKFALVDGATRQVSGDAPTTPQTAYERWVLAQIETQSLAEISRQRDTAFAVAEWLDSREADQSLIETAPSNLISAILEVNPDVVRDRLQSELARTLPDPLLDRATDYLYQHLSATALFYKLRQGFISSEVAAALYDSYAVQKFAPPPSAELKALPLLLAETEHALLSLFVAFWASPRRQLPEALQASEMPLYRQFVEMALSLGLLEPLKLLVPERGSAFLDLYLTTRVEDWVDLVEALLAVEEAACLSRLTGPLSKLSRKELHALAKLTRQQPDVPPDFLAALEAAIAALPPERGVKGFLKSAWRRLPGVGE
jgi:hypothetical protein